LILEESGDEWAFNEGCLSIPDVREDVFRKPNIKVQYQDEDFKTHTMELSGIAARVFQHEYDHIEGILFTDYLSPLKRKLIQKKLNNITNGEIEIEYKMRFPKKVKK
jgi:peptide deformylase